MIKCIKLILRTSAHIVSVIGLIVIGFGLYVLYNQVGLNYSQLYYNSADWLKTLQEYGFIILGILIFIIGCAGVYGAKKKKPSCKKTCLFIYEIGAIIFFALFTTLAIFTLVYSNDIFGTECDNTTYFKDVDTQLQAADQLFCSSECQCYVEQSIVDNNATAFSGKTYTTDNTVEGTVTQVQKCSAFSEESYGAAASLMQAAETLLHCTGWCTETSYYIFSDINSGIPDGKSCFVETKDFVESNGAILGYVLLGLAILFGLNVLFVICLCCMSDKKKRINFYHQIET